MPNPWDRPPFPAHGDPEQDYTYAGVGRVISRWEEIESELSHIYAIFIGQFQTEEGYDLYYVSGKTAAGRIATTKQAAESYFIRHPNQGNEAAVCDLLARISEFAQRRHEVAHGVVRPMQWYGLALPQFKPPIDAPFQFCVVPPHYQRDWFDTNRMPKYIYTSNELLAIEGRLFDLLRETITVKFFFLK